MGGFEGLLFSCVISHGIGGFEDVCEDSGWEFFEEQVGGFSVSLGVSSLSGEFFEIGDVLRDIGPSHSALLEGDPSSLLLIGILELSFEFIKELGPDDREVVLDLVEPVNPYSHVSDPSCHFVSFDKGESKGDLFDWRIESCNVFIDAEVCFDFFDEFVGFGSIAGELVGEVSHCFNICCSLYWSLALACGCRLARRRTSAATAASTAWVSTTECNVELVEDFGGGMSTSSGCLSSRTTSGTGSCCLGLLGSLGGGGGRHSGAGWCLRWKRHLENSGVDWRKTALKRASWA